MRIVVCGAGQVGLGIARQLVREDNHVTLIDENPEVIRKINETLDIAAYTGIPSHPTVLEEVGALNAEMIIAVTTNDEVNMIICQVAHSLFNIPVKIARIRSQNYLLPIWKDLYRKDHLPIDHIISPEMEVARAIMNRLHVPGGMDMVPFADNRINVIEIRCPEKFPIAGLSISKIISGNPELKMSIIGLVRGKDFTIPDNNEKIQPGDEVFLAIDSSHMQKIMALFGHEEKEARRILIVGGGNIGMYLSELIEAEDNEIHLKMIEKTKERAEYIANHLNDRITVLYGNCLDQEILSEAGVDSTETVIAVTNDDEVNILTSLLAKRFGAQRSITLINKGSSYEPLIASLGIDVIVNPREITVSSILQYVRRGKVRAAQSICGGKAEIIETEATAKSAIIGKTIRDLGLPHTGMRVAAIVRGEETIIPDDTTVIAESDRIIIISHINQIKKVDAIFAERVDYF